MIAAHKQTLSPKPYLFWIPLYFSGRPSYSASQAWGNAISGVTSYSTAKFIRRVSVFFFMFFSIFFSIIPILSPFSSVDDCLGDVAVNCGKCIEMGYRERLHQNIVVSRLAQGSPIQVGRISGRVPLSDLRSQRPKDANVFALFFTSCRQPWIDDDVGISRSEAPPYGLPNTEQIIPKGDFQVLEISPCL